MALSGANNAEKIWNRLISEGFSECGAAGLMGNLYAESALNPKNLQNTYEKKLGYTDDAYTAAVDNGRQLWKFCERQRRLRPGPVDVLVQKTEYAEFCTGGGKIHRGSGNAARFFVPRIAGKL